MKCVQALTLLCVIFLTACASGPTIAESKANVAAYDALPTTPDTVYRIGNADVLQINVFDEPALSFDEVTVDSTGAIPFPLIGAVSVAGRTSREIADDIAGRLSQQYLIDPQVTVFVKASARQRLTIEGDVRKPGIFDIKGDTNLLQAMALSEGPLQTAKLDEIIVFRTVGTELYAAQFDLREVRVGAQPNIPLEGGDIVVVGSSRAKSLFRDVLQAAPLLSAAFVRLL